MNARPEPVANELMANRLLALLPQTERERVGRHLASCVLDPGQVLQHESTEIEHVYFPTSGIIASTLMVPDAADVTVSIVGREGAVFSEGAGALGPSFVRATV